MKTKTAPPALTARDDEILPRPASVTRVGPLKVGVWRLPRHPAPRSFWNFFVAEVEREFPEFAGCDVYVILHDREGTSWVLPGEQWRAQKCLAATWLAVESRRWKTPTRDASGLWDFRGLLDGRSAAKTNAAGEPWGLWGAGHGGVIDKAKFHPERRADDLKREHELLRSMRKQSNARKQRKQQRAAG